MNTTPQKPDPAAHATLLVQIGASLNSLNAALRQLGTFKTTDKKLQAGWPEMRRLSAQLFTRLLISLDAPSGDYLNEVANQSEQLLRCLAYLPADQRRKLVAHAEDVAAPFAAVECHDPQPLNA